jgi:hypothetical protein
VDAALGREIRYHAPVQGSQEGSAPPPRLGSLTTLLTAGPGALSRALGPWVLVGPDPAATDDDNDWAFRTVSVKTVRLPTGEGIVDLEHVVYGLKKAKDGPFANTILIGRSGSNDICLPHSSVSKLHARARLQGSKLTLSDAGSSNGTSCNGATVSDQEVSLTSGDILRFGACTFQLFAVDIFADVLRVVAADL